MKKFLVSIALASSVIAAAAPAVAQDYRGDRYDRSYDDRRGDDRRWDRGDDRRWDNRGDIRPRMDRLSYAIRNGEQRGTLSRREGQMLRSEHAAIWSLARQFNRSGGYDRRELMILERRIDRLQQNLRAERQDYDRRYR